MTTPVASPQDRVDEEGAFGWLGARLGTTARRAELLVGVVLALCAVALTAHMARGLWFRHDEWEFLVHRTAFDPDSLFRPWTGHWQTWSVLLLRGIYHQVGLDFWPWFYLPRLVGHTLLVVFIWRVMRHRGADPVVAIFAYSILLVLGASGYQRALQIGNWAVFAALIGCALVISRRRDPTTRDQVIVAGALLVAVLGNGYAVAVIGGIVGALILARRLVVWIPSLVPPVAAYGLWYLHYRNTIPTKPEPSIHTILRIPSGAFRIVRTAVETGTAFPGWLAALTVVGIAAWIIVLLVRRRLDLFDSIILCTLAVSLALLTIERVSVAGEAATRLRYGYSVSLLLALVLVPHLRFPRPTVARALFVAVALWVLAANVNTFRVDVNQREVAAQAIRVSLVAAAGMVNAGEPVVAGPSPVSAGLNTHDLMHLIHDGFMPGPLPEDQPDRAAIEAAARGALRMNFIDRQRHPDADIFLAEGTRPTTDASVDADGCATVDQEAPVTAIVSDAAVLTVDKAPGQALVGTWTDRYGVGVRRFENPAIPKGAVELADPDGTAELTLESTAGSLTVCGFALG